MRMGLLAAAWLAGVLLAFTVAVSPDVAWLLAGAAVLVAFGLWMARAPVPPAVLAAVLLLGLGRAEAGGPHSGVSSLVGKNVVATGSIADDPETTSRQVRFELRVSQVQVDGAARPLDERWLVYGNPPDDLVSRRSAPYFRYGDLVIVVGAPIEPQPVDGFDYEAYLAAQGISATMFAEETKFVGEGGTSWRAAVYAARGRMAASIEQVMPYPESALATAMLLGKRESLPPELVEKFRDTGAAHMLAISGLHVGVLLAVVAGSAAWMLGRQRPTYLVVAGVAIWLYALAAGASPSALRAAVMGTVYLAALGLGRPSSLLSALALAAALMTALSPGLVRQVSFQLSFAAVGGIALLLTAMGGRFNRTTSPSAGWTMRLLGWAAALIIISAAATMATWPLAAANFGQVALLGVPVSLLAVPAMAPLILTAMLAAVAGVVFEPLGVLLGWVAAAPTAYVIGVISAFPSWTLEGHWVGKPLLAVWYGGLGIALLAAQPHHSRRWRRGIGACASRVAALLRARPSGSPRAGDGAGVRWPVPNPYITLTAAVALGIAATILWIRVADSPDGLLQVHYLDVGQGDSTLIVTPSGRQVLVDGGPDGDVTSLELADAMPGGDRSLDLVVMTQPDTDHSRGLLEVLDRYTVGAVLTGPDPTDSQALAEWEQRLGQHGITPVVVSSGYKIILDEDVELAILNPWADRLFGDSNNDAVAIRLTYGNVSVLLTADIEAEAEQRLLTSGLPLSSTVLKVGHHGSSTSTTQGFLDAVSPAIAVVSAGIDNQYGHPAADVLSRLEAALGSQNVYRTDRQGTIEVNSDGQALWVQTER